MSEEKCNYCEGKNPCAYKKELEECDLCHKPVCECDDCRMVVTVCFSCPSLLQLQPKIQALKEVYEKYKEDFSDVDTTLPQSVTHEFWQAIKAVCEEEK